MKLATRSAYQIVTKKGLYRARKVIKQTNLLVISDRSEAVNAAIDSVLHHRKLLEVYIDHNPGYQYALSPVKVEEDAPRVVKMAAEAVEMAKVGPMAAIPGALAELAVEAMKSYGGSTNIVENGGEMAGYSMSPINIGIHAGPSVLSDRIGFHLREKDFPIGIATSSATVGHALTFGEADAAVVIADSASIADATATAVCNAVRGKDVGASIQRGLRVAKMLPIRSALIIRGKRIGTVGKLPKILRIDEHASEL